MVLGAPALAPLGALGLKLWNAIVPAVPTPGTKTEIHNQTNVSGAPNSRIADDIGRKTDPIDARDTTAMTTEGQGSAQLALGII